MSVVCGGRNGLFISILIWEIPDTSKRFIVHEAVVKSGKATMLLDNLSAALLNKHHLKKG